MKNLTGIFIAILVLASCSSTKESKTTKQELKREKVLAEQAALKEAIETRQFIVKFDRLYFRHGGWAQLRPRANFLIVDGKKAIVSSAYIGSYFSALPIEGIRVQGDYADYELINNTSKGMYEIKLKVSRGGDTFDLFLTVGKNGQCNTSLSSLKIDYVSYSGQVVPIDRKEFKSTKEVSTI
jgi:hypothetical protein